MNKICDLLNIKYPVIQAGMVWCSGWELASAVANAGGLGLIGAGSMYPEILRDHIRKCKQAANGSFGINIPLMRQDAEKLIQVILEEEIKIVFTSAGNPATWTPVLKQNAVTVVHVVSNTRFAKKAEDCGADAVVAEGFEAGGHNGREETTTMCLLPVVRAAVSIPLIAAGGIASGKAMLAAMALGADAVQVGSRFAASSESSAHINFKDAIIKAAEGDTSLRMKKLVPVRLLKNDFSGIIEELESRGADKEELTRVLGRSRARLGMFEGNLQEGELEIGQVSALIDTVKPAADILNEIWKEFLSEKERLSKLEI